MITFQCECGKAHKIPDEHAGKRGKCSACGTTMRIPGSRPATARTTPLMEKPASKVKELSRGNSEDLSHLYDLDDQDAPRPALAPRGRPCPNCKKPLPSLDAIFCIECGYNLKTGKVRSVEVVKPERAKKRKSSHASKFLEQRLTSKKFLGGLFSLIGGSVWLVLGLMADRLFFYPLFLIIGGIIGIFSGLIGGDD